jgi:hypothetical protein
MNSSDHSAMERRYAAAYAAMAAFEDAPHPKDQTLSDYPLAEQFKIDLVLWTVERVRHMGRPVDAAWLLHELLSFCTHFDDVDGDVDGFIERSIFGRLYIGLWDELEQHGPVWSELNRITDTLVDLLESVE